MYLHNKEPLALPDTQSLPDYRGLAVSGAGIGDLRLPVHLRDVDGAAIHTIGRFQVHVGVPPSIRGTHMSRLVAFAETYASDLWVDNLYSLLEKKYVTERAYENPKFAEDLARDVYAALFRRYGDCVYSVRVENQESIHNHTAQAWIGNEIWEDSHE